MYTFIIAIIVVFHTLVISVIWYNQGMNDIKKEAFDRGYMVECVGKSGYYWDCEE